ncbi:hypothetical protein FQZ97_505800 [compost metagenome]
MRSCLAWLPLTSVWAAVDSSLSGAVDTLIQAAMFVSWGLGLSLALMAGRMGQGWLFGKISIVVALFGVHGVLRSAIRARTDGGAVSSSAWHEASPILVATGRATIAVLVRFEESRAASRMQPGLPALLGPTRRRQGWRNRPLPMRTALAVEPVGHGPRAPMPRHRGWPKACPEHLCHRLL